MTFPNEKWDALNELKKAKKGEEMPLELAESEMSMQPSEREEIERLKREVETLKMQFEMLRNDVHLGGIRVRFMLLES